MNLFRISLLICFFFGSSAIAQEKEYETLTVSGQPLRQGQVIQVSFKADKESRFDKNKEVYAILFSYTKGKPIATDTLLKAGKKAMLGSFTLPKDADLIVLKFVQGDHEENNEGKGYFFEVADKAGNKQPGTLYSLYRIYSGESFAGIKKPNADLAAKYHKLWFVAQDPGKLSYYEKAAAYYVEKDTINLCKHFSEIPHNEGITENEFSILSVYARPCGRATVARIENEHKKRFPYGSFSLRPWNDSIKTFSTNAEKLVWIKAFKMAVPQDTLNKQPFADELYFDLFRTATRNLDGTFMRTIPQYQAGKLNDDRLMPLTLDFGSRVLKKDTLTDDALILSSYYLSRLKEQSESLEGKYASQSSQMYRQNRQDYYFQFSSIYGAALAKNSQTDSAIYYSRLAAAGSEFRIANINERYFNILEKITPAAEMVEVMKPAFLNKGYNSAIKLQYIRLYNQSGKGDGEKAFNDLFASEKTALYAEIKKKLITTKQPAPDFLLKGLNGGETSLSDLKGKVVLLDFWATWCAPCIGSFPAMQVLVDNNLNRNDVAIFFVDTWQKESDKYAVVKNFFKENPYRFKVLMDAADKAVKDFNVSGIPTKVVIDKNGMIRFFSVGANRDELKTVNELQAMIDIAGEIE